MAEPGVLIEFRLSESERRLKAIEDTNPAGMREMLTDLKNEVRGLRRDLYIFSLTVASSAIAVAFTVVKFGG